MDDNFPYEEIEVADLPEEDSIPTDDDTADTYVEGVDADGAEADQA